MFFMDFRLFIDRAFWNLYRIRLLPLRFLDFAPRISDIWSNLYRKKINLTNIYRHRRRNHKLFSGLRSIIPVRNLNQSWWKNITLWKMPWRICKSLMLTVLMEPYGAVIKGWIYIPITRNWIISRLQCLQFSNGLFELQDAFFWKRILCWYRVR